MDSHLFLDVDCPTFSCLGTQTCLFPNSCFCSLEYELDGFIDCYVNSFVEASSQSSCEAENTTCNVENIEVDDCEEFVCAYCPHGGDCVAVLNVTSVEQCSLLGACELSDGSVRYDLTSIECMDTQSACTAECNGASCRPWNGIGACVLDVNISLCEDFGGSAYYVYEDSVCVLEDFTSEISCNKV